MDRFAVPDAAHQLADGHFRQPQPEGVPHRFLVSGASTQPEQLTGWYLRQRQFADKPTAVIIGHLVTGILVVERVLAEFEFAGVTHYRGENNRLVIGQSFDDAVANIQPDGDLAARLGVRVGRLTLSILLLINAWMVRGARTFLFFALACKTKKPAPSTLVHFTSKLVDLRRIRSNIHSLQFPQFFSCN